MWVLLKFSLPLLKLHLIRHGETEFNATGIVQGGGIDSDLNATGRQQAQWFWQRHRFTRYAPTVWASGLKRTHQTLAPFLEDGYQLRTHPGLNEFSWGEWEGQKFDQDFQDIIRPYAEAWAAGDLDLAVPGGDTPRIAWTRAQAALQDILATHPDGNVLVCTHGRLLRILISGVLHNDVAQMHRYMHHNTGLNILARPEPSAEFVAELLNCTAHLPVH